MPAAQLWFLIALLREILSISDSMSVKVGTRHYEVGVGKNTGLSLVLTKYPLGNVLRKNFRKDN